VERFFVAEDSSWREILRGERRSTERGFRERLSPWREQPRRDDLQGENLSVERFFEERLSPERTWTTHARSTRSHLLYVIYVTH
jgi:hypothetical protein